MSGTGGTSGPIPKPKHLHLLDGETRPSRVNYDEPEVPQLEVQPPDGMSEAAMEHWNRLAPICLKMGTLTVADVDAFREFCEAVVSAREAQAELDQDGEVIDYPVFDRAGIQVASRPVVNPWWKIRREASTAVFAGAARFGLTPADRTRIRVNESGVDKKSAHDNSDLLSG